MTVTIHHGDSRDVLKTMADASVDSVVCDPPYALVSIGKRFGAENAAPAKAGKTGAYQRASAGFMGKQWDTGETAFAVEFWAEVMRVLKPGGHVVAFSGTRTYHRLACAVEDAGFEIRDMLSWLYGSGFPKSHDVSKGIDRAAGATPIPTGEIKRASIQRNGSGEAWDQGAFASHPEDTKRVEITRAATAEAAQWTGWGTALKPACEPIVLARKPLAGTVAANVLAHGTGALNIAACRVEGVKPQVTQGVNSNPSSFHVAKERRLSGDPNEGRWPANVVHDGSDEVMGAFPERDGATSNSRSGVGGIAAEGLGPATQTAGRGDTGSAARFFYTAKADATDRLGSKHPTVKPTDLMRWLVRLVTPPGGVVLDPFAGSGSTGVACIAEGFDAILIEREADYVADIRRRIAWAQGEGRLTAQEMQRNPQVDDAGAGLPLFGGAAA